MVDSLLHHETATGSFEQAFGRMRPILLRAATKVLRNEADAEEVVQETALAGWQHRSSLRDRRYLCTWLYRINLNVALSRMRMRRPDHLTELQADRLTSPEPDAERALVSSSQLAQLRRAVEGLPTAYREPLLLSCVEDLSYAQIGERLGLLAATAKSRVWRARQMVMLSVARRNAKR